MDTLADAVLRRHTLGDEVPGRLDHFYLAPVTYPPALDERDMDAYRSRLAEVGVDRPGTAPAGNRWTVPHAHAWFTPDWNVRRLDVLEALDQDITYGDRLQAH